DPRRIHGDAPRSPERRDGLARDGKAERHRVVFERGGAAERTEHVFARDGKTRAGRVTHREIEVRPPGASASVELQRKGVETETWMNVRTLREPHRVERNA